MIKIRGGKDFSDMTMIHQGQDKSSGCISIHTQVVWSTKREEDCQSIWRDDHVY